MKCVTKTSEHFKKCLIAVNVMSLRSLQDAETIRIAVMSSLADVKGRTQDVRLQFFEMAATSS